MTDLRRAVPRTDRVLADPRLVAATRRLGPAAVKAAVRTAQAQVRAGRLTPEAVPDRAVSLLPGSSTTLRPVLNATGVVLHTNLGRAALSAGAIEAMSRAAGYVDVEFDLATGSRAGRGRGTIGALLSAVPAAPAALVVNNGAAALVLATTALAAGREVIVSRGELVEIGDGFRLPDLITSTGARIREVGTTNRTSVADYAGAIGPETACILKIHPSNFHVVGFTSSASAAELAELPIPVVVDVGSGLLRPDPALPGEPDVTTALLAGAALVTCSGDKLLGGPQAGLVFGAPALVEQLRRHPLARALRTDKITLAALEATVRGPATPTWQALRADADELRGRTQALAAAVGASVVPSSGAVGGGGAPGLLLPGWAVALPESYAAPLRLGDPSVVGRLERGRYLLDLRCVAAADDERVRAAVLACGPAGPGDGQP